MVDVSSSNAAPGIEESGFAASGVAPAVSGRPLRKDAERNRQRILLAAAEVFTERGLEATLDDVARHAGVGVGTVYRRFPDKAALADALFEQRIDLLVGLAERAYGEPDPWQGLVSFLERAGEMMATDKGLRQILMFTVVGTRPRLLRQGPDAPRGQPLAGAGPGGRAGAGRPGPDRYSGTGIHAGHYRRIRP